MNKNKMSLLHYAVKGILFLTFLTSHLTCAMSAYQSKEPEHLKDYK